MRIISGSHYRSRTNPLLNYFNVLSVKDIYNHELGTFMYKHLLPCVLDDLFVKHSDIHGFNTRHKNCLRLPKLRKYFVSSQLDLLVLDFGTTSMIQLRAPQILSNLGIHIRIISCKIIFKFMWYISLLNLYCYPSHYTNINVHAHYLVMAAVFNFI